MEEPRTTLGNALGGRKGQFPEPALSHQPLPCNKQPTPYVQRKSSHRNLVPDCFKLNVTQNKKHFRWGWKHKGPLHPHGGASLSPWLLPHECQHLRESSSAWPKAAWKMSLQLRFASTPPCPCALQANAVPGLSPQARAGRGVTSDRDPGTHPGSDSSHAGLPG